MSIAKPFTFVANTYAKASEVNADFDTVYAQVNTNISAIAQNATDIDNLENNKANINGDYSQRFAVANPTTNTDAVNKQYLISAIGNSIDYISGLVITKDSGSPEDTIIVSSGSCYDSTKSVVLSLSDATSKQNDNQGASTTYYVYIIGDAIGATIDILISSSSTTPSLPSGYTLYRQIGYYTTDSDSNIDTIYTFGQSPNSSQPQATITKVYKNGSSWYRVWSDGWIEQGGVLQSSTSSISLLKSYSDTNYIVLACEAVGRRNYASSYQISDKTTSSFSCWTGLGSSTSGGDWGAGVMWIAQGY